MCKVVNKYKEPYDIYIGRGSILGNPFPINEVIGDTREVVIDKFRQHLWQCIRNETITKEYLASLDGKVLGCFCKPKACHGDVIVQAVAWAVKELSRSSKHVASIISCASVGL